MTWKTNTAAALTVVVLGVGAAAALEPPDSPHEQQRRNQEQQISDLQDSHDREIGRRDDDAEDLRRAEDANRALPGEHRPADPKLPRLPLRW